MSRCRLKRPWSTRAQKKSSKSSVGRSPTRCAWNCDAEVQPGPAREVDHRARERLVERHVGVAEADDALLVAERLLQRLAERDPDVLDRVVGVDVQVALAAHVEVEAGVRGERGQHVVEEADAGARSRERPCAVEVQRQADVGLARLALDRGSSERRGARSSGSRLRAARHQALPVVRSMPASVERRPQRVQERRRSPASVPTLTRRQRDSSGYEVTSRTSTPRAEHRREDRPRVRADGNSRRKKFAREG